MKKIIAFIFLFASIASQAQNEITPAITALGKPDGEKTEMKIDKEGGSFTSSDGKVRLIIPEGAVSKKTTFSIQPTTNLAPNGNGKAYQMEPSGINFQKPLQIIFKYSNDDTEGNSPELLGIAMQDDKGLWSSLNKTVTDSVARTLTSDIRHFSSYVNFSRAKIDPSSARVKVNGSLRLKIIQIAPPSEDDDLLSPLSVIEATTTVLWHVNEIPRGNSAVGLISASQNYSAIYQAPAQIPEQNPVAVTVQTVNTGFSKKYGPTKLVSNITIYDDAYEVKMEAVLMGGSPAAWGGVATYIDDGSFIVSLEKNKPAVINIKNHLEKITYSTCPNRVITNPNTCTGILHVKGTRQIKVTPANPPNLPYPLVEIWFAQYPTELTRFTFDCPPPPSAKGRSKGKVDLTTSAPGQPPPLLMFFGMPALPTYIKFIAKEEEQILIEKGSPGSEIYYKFSVQKVK
jgi:hypothetical protein